jgi:hypothetical protein
MIMLLGHVGGKPSMQSANRISSSRSVPVGGGASSATTLYLALLLFGQRLELDDHLGRDGHAFLPATAMPPL